LITSFAPLTEAQIKGSITSLLMNSEYTNGKKVIESQKSSGHSF